MGDDRIEMDVTLRKENNAGCLILLLDFAALTMGIAMILHNEGLHMVFSILIGLAITIAFIFLARIPYVGRLFQIALGLVWGLIAYSILDNVFHYSKDVGLMTGLRENDLIWWWAIVIFVDLGFIGIHIAAFNKYLGTLNFRKKAKPTPQSGRIVEILDGKNYEIKKEPEDVMFSDNMPKPLSLKDDDVIFMGTSVFTDDNDLNK